MGDFLIGSTTTSKQVICVVVVVGFASTAYGQKIYWAETFSEPCPPSCVSHHKILRADPDGSNIEQAVDTSPYFATSFALDCPLGKIYWTAIGVFSKEITPGKIQRANLNGTQIEDLATLAPGAYSEIAVDPILEKIYWTDAFMIRRADLNGNNVEDIIALSREGGGPIAIDTLHCIPTLAPWGIVALLVGLIAAGLVIMRRRLAGRFRFCHSIPYAAPGRVGRWMRQCPGGA